MAFAFILPDIGEGVVEGEIVKWHVQEGDQVKEDQTLVEIMTDKATVAIPSPRAGRILKLAVKEGQVAKVGKMLLEIEEAASKPAVPVHAAVHVPPAAAQRVVEQKGVPPRFAGDNLQLVASTGQRELLAAPAVRKLAREEGIDLAKVSGTGPMGRITREDVLTFAQGGQLLSFQSGGGTAGAVNANAERMAPVAPAARVPLPPPAAARVPLPPPAPARAPSPPPAAPAARAAGDRRVAIRGLRKRIYEKMHQSKTTAAHFTYVEEVDLTELVAVRERTKSRLAEQGLKLTYLPYIMKATVMALRKFPHVNAHVDDAAMELVVKHEYHLGFAVQTDDGLMVPVVRDVDKKSIVQLARELEELSNKARNKQATAQELSGSTFTITSLGQLGGVLATPVINYPEVAILGVHAIKKRPAVASDGKTVVVRDLANFSSSFDHRLIDGYVGAQFMAELKKYLEDPQLLFMELV